MSNFVDNSGESPLTIDTLESMLIATSGVISGCDSDEKDYTSIKQLWKDELKPNKAKPEETIWYSNGKSSQN